MLAALRPTSVDSLYCPMLAPTSSLNPRPRRPVGAAAAGRCRRVRRVEPDARRPCAEEPGPPLRAPACTPNAPGSSAQAWEPRRRAFEAQAGVCARA